MVSNYLRERLGTVLVAPPGYTTPPFPSLYWPLPPNNARYLYYNTDIWRFTLFWTLLIFTAFHLAAGLYAFLMMLLAASASSSKNKTKNRDEAGKGKVKIKSVKRKGRGQRYAAALVVPFVFIFIGALEAVLSGSVVGFILAAVYNAGYFRLSTLIPPIWGLINVLVIILSSYSVHGAL